MAEPVLDRPRRYCLRILFKCTFWLHRCRLDLKLYISNKPPEMPEAYAARALSSRAYSGRSLSAMSPSFMSTLDQHLSHCLAWNKCPKDNFRMNNYLLKRNIKEQEKYREKECIHVNPIFSYAELANSFSNATSMLAIKLIHI